MFGWVKDIIDGIGDAIVDAFAKVAETLSSTIWTTMLRWMYDTVYGAIADFFTMIGNMGADLFDLPWIQWTIQLFTLLGWSLFIVGMVIAIFDVAVEYQTGRANIKTTILNILKGFFACSLIGVVPVELYKFTISLQNTFAHEMAWNISGYQINNFQEQAKTVLNYIGASVTGMSGLLALCVLIAFTYCIVKLFFQNIKRGGILLVQISVGSLYMFSVPRGYTDGFTQWMKQIIATCLTAFMQTTMMYLGLLTFPTNMLLGLGIMLAANEVPRVAAQFGMDSSMRFNIMSAVHAATTAINLTRIISKAK